MGVARRLLLAASTNSWLLARATKTPFVRRSVSRFMPGERIDDAIRAAVRLHASGIGAILTHLGENLSSSDAADGETLHYAGVLREIETARIDAQISVKPTQLGLDLDREICWRNLLWLLDRADELGKFVWLDMESAKYVDATLDLFGRARERSRSVGIALQAYLYRTERDVESLLPGRPAIRLVKGAYLEPPSVAMPGKADVDENYFRLACRILGSGTGNGTFLHIATHDPRLIHRLNAYIVEHNVAPATWEYAMLYGIQEALQRRIVASGGRLRILISYGEHWFPWYMRRLAERPANVWFVLRNLRRASHSNLFTGSFRPGVER